MLLIRRSRYEILQQMKSSGNKNWEPFNGVSVQKRKITKLAPELYEDHAGRAQECPPSRILPAFVEGQEKHAGNLEQNLKQIRIQQNCFPFKI